MPNYPYTFQLPPLNVQDIPNDGVAGEFLGINGSGVLDWLTAGGGGTGDMLKADNLLGLTSYPTARTNLGLGTGDSPTFKNLVISAGTLTSDAPVTISQTWNNAAVAFTGLKVNAVSTDSLTTSKLLDLQAGGVSKFNVDRTGNINVDPTNGSAVLTFKVGAGTAFQYYGGSGWGSQPLNVMAAAGLSVSQGILQLGANTILLRDGADNTLALRNGAAAQTFNVYGTYTSGASYARLAIACDTSGNATLTTQSTGVAGTVSINGIPMRSRGTGDIVMGVNAAATTTAGYNVYIGVNAGGNTTTGGYNVCLGTNAVVNETSNNTVIGGGAAAIGGVGANNQVVIGNNATGLGLNSVVLGNDSITKTALKGNVGIGTTAPGSTLTVAGTFHFGSNNGALAGGVTYGGHLGGSRYFGLRGISAESTSLFLQNSSSGDKNAQIRILGSGSGVDHGALNIMTVESSPITFTTGITNEQMRITSAGNVGIGTTSPTSKLHVVGDAVLTGQLLGSNYTVGIADSVTQANIAITNNHVGFADSFLVLTPKGTGGVIFGPKPDGTATGGNARGIYSVDLQTSAKTGPAQVASGAYSALVGGQANRASGAHSFCGGGNANTPSGTFSVTCGGQSNIASGGQSFIGGGISNTVSSTNAFIAGGIQGLADRYGISAHSSGQIATPGDAQKTTAVFRNKTTTNSAVELFLDGASARYTVTSGKIISMLINITGTKSDGSAVAHYVRQYSIKNIGGTTSQVYAAVTVGTDNAAGTSIAISADDTNDSLKIEVTGVASETWRWVASVDAVEVGHGT